MVQRGGVWLASPSQTQVIVEKMIGLFFQYNRNLWGKPSEYFFGISRNNFDANIEFTSFHYDVRMKSNLMMIRRQYLQLIKYLLND